MTQSKNPIQSPKTMRFVNKLDTHSQMELAELMRTSPSFKVRKRAHAILLSHKGYKIDDLALIFEADRDTISSWLKRWEEEGLGGLSDAPRSGRPRNTEKRES